MILTFFVIYYSIFAMDIRQLEIFAKIGWAAPTGSIRPSFDPSALLRTSLPLCGNTTLQGVVWVKPA